MSTWFPYCYHCGAERQAHEEQCSGCGSRSFVSHRQQTYGRKLMQDQPPASQLKEDLEAVLLELNRSIDAAKRRAEESGYSVYTQQDRHGALTLPRMLIEKAQVIRELEHIYKNEQMLETNRRILEKAMLQPMTYLQLPDPPRKRWFV